jgi:tetratricopeptide (TPR) repeat protein
MTMKAVAEILSRASAAKKERLFSEALALLEPLLKNELPPTGALLLASDVTQLIDPTPDGYRRAEAYLRRALDLDPASVEATIELGYLLRTAEAGISPRLKETIERATILVDQADVMLTLLRAAVLRDQGNWKEAYDLILPAAARHPNSRLLAQELDLLKDTLNLA